MRNEVKKTFARYYKKWNFPLRISSISVINSVGNSQFVFIYWKNLHVKIYFLCSGNITMLECKK